MKEDAGRTKPSRVSGEQWEAVKEILGFYGHEYLEEVLLKGLNGPDGPSEDIQKDISYAMLIAGVFYNNRFLSKEIDVLLDVSMEYDRDMMARQLKRAEGLTEEGYKARVIGEEVFAYDAGRIIETEGRRTRIWRLKKYDGAGQASYAEVAEAL